MLKYLALGAFLLLSAHTASAQTLTVHITGIRTAEGGMRVSFFTNQEELDREAPPFEKVIPKAGMKEGRITLMLPDLPPGTYGIAVLDDVNADGKMNYRWWKPVEGYGFSNFRPGKLRKPRFAEFRFPFKEEDQVVSVELLYW
jgi:uncharacterized protein (DUF2141 family)